MGRSWWKIVSPHAPSWYAVCELCAEYFPEDPPVVLGNRTMDDYVQLKLKCPRGH